ncbi:hypothetical protein HFN65_31430 [Rhizobium laguerreae]|uniref:hypothetical protein n=1 Tax=Rhizobium laguerreae TaxID=1076926 RepID=UPI001C90A844|nr:hypothetical protein [Rhizobium laguerreae]MBY3575452.1 hypothetical protein [Rhizobium laguerreae]
MLTCEPTSTEYHLSVPKGRDHFLAIRQAKARGFDVVKRNGRTVVLIGPEATTSLVGTVFDPRRYRRP